MRHGGVTTACCRVGLSAPEKVYAELGEIVARKKPGRLSDDEIIIFDSTGTALQDVAAAAMVYDRDIERRANQPLLVNWQERVIGGLDDPGADAFAQDFVF